MPAWHEVKAHLPELATRTCDVRTMIGRIRAVCCVAQAMNEMFAYFSRACTEHEAGGRLATVPALQRAESQVQQCSEGKHPMDLHIRLVCTVR